VKLRITILGSGTGIPWRARAGPGWVLTAEGGSGADAVLVDPSAGSSQRMADRGIPLDRLTHVLFTHYHPDHTGDLVPILFALRNPRFRDRPPLRLIGPRGLRKLLRELRGVYGDWIEPPQGVEATEIGGAEGDPFVRVGALEVTPFPTDHADPSIALRILCRGGPTIAYTGDTDRCDGAVEAARGADLLLIECSFPEGGKRPGHLVPSEAGRIAEAAGARRAVLIHMYPECHGHDLLGSFRRWFSGEAALAEDGMVIEA
jgi:ribonuclease BN (tRNA processing enzyme)